MSSASSVVRCLVLIGVASYVLVGCAASAVDSGTDPTTSTDAGKKDSGKKDASGGGKGDDDDDTGDDDTGDDDSGTGDDDTGDDDSGTGDDDTGDDDSDSGTGDDDTGDDDTDSGTGDDDTGDDDTDSGTGDDDDTTDSGTTTDSSVGGWVDMSTDNSACHGKANVPCGWSATPTNTGFTCLCRHGSWAEGWTCEAANAAVAHGPSCP